MLFCNRIFERLPGLRAYRGWEGFEAFDEMLNVLPEQSVGIQAVGCAGRVRQTQGKELAEYAGTRIRDAYGSQSTTEM